MILVVAEDDRLPFAGPGALEVWNAILRLSKRGEPKQCQDNSQSFHMVFLQLTEAFTALTD
jgi:hypothetical protein